MFSVYTNTIVYGESYKYNLWDYVRFIIWFVMLMIILYLIVIELLSMLNKEKTIGMYCLQTCV